MKLSFPFALILAGSAALPFLLSAQTPAGGGNASEGVGPIIKFNTESYDFGKALSGDTVSYTYLVTNAGDAMLDVSSVKAGCSCTVIGGSWTPHIAPHETGIIPVSVHTSGTGPIDKMVTVASNDKARTNVILHVRGTLWVPIEVNPFRAYFTIKPDGRSVAPQVLKIINRTDKPLILSAPQSSTPAFSAVLTTNKPGQEFELKITVTPPDPATNAPGPGYLQGTISMKTSSSNMAVLNVVAMATIQPEIQFLPPQIQMQSGPLPRGLTNYISVLNNTAAPLKVLDATADAPGVNVAINVLTPNQNYSVAVGFPQGFEFKPNQKVVISIKTDNPRYPAIEVPILPMQPLPRRPLPAPTPVALPGKS
ncbi:MAG: DUF1573 domain-containing protein [Verrucomicrobiota bacterium]|jgi:hypothetical protein